MNGVLVGPGNSVTLKAGDVLSLLVPGTTCKEFDPEESIVYRYVPAKSPPPLAAAAAAPSNSSATGKLKTPAELNAQLAKLLTAQTPADVEDRKVAERLAKETSQPEDFVRVVGMNPSAEVLHTLSVALETRDESWLRAFIEMCGLDQLADVLSLKCRTQVTRQR